MYVELGPWFSDDIKENRLYSEQEVEAIILSVKREEDKKALEAILTDLRTQSPR